MISSDRFADRARWLKGHDSLTRFMPRALAGMTVGLMTTLGVAAERLQPLSPEAALAAFQLEPGLRIELVAAEPLVVDPVAFAFDENRRLYVVENRGYPDPLDGKKAPPEGRIALLEDTNGDGRYDRRTEFATGLSYPNGILLWKGGVFVTCAPDIYYLKDTNGDGVADERRVVLTGFDATKTAQIRVSHPTLGLDGKIYVTSGLNGGKVTSPEHPERPAVTFSPADGRFDPESLTFENTGGRSQFGLTFDAFGRRFGSTNRQPVLQMIMEPSYLRRNPHLAFADTVQEVSKVQAEAKVYPISRASVSADYIPKLMSDPHSGTFTSACGLLVFGGTGLSPEHTGNVFICEPAQNLVQRQVMRPDGASFRSEPPYKGREFLASTDVWFRPVFLGEGPDGALYVADMHRREIDHPQYVPEETRPKLNFDGGKSAGRIYRIVKGPRGATPAPGFTVADLCRSLESPYVWWRERGRRLLLERGDPAAVPLLEKCAADAALPESRTIALWILRDLGRLSTASILTALRDSTAGVREQGVTLAAEFLPRTPELVVPLLASGDDSDARVRFLAALALGSMEDPRAVGKLAAIAVRDGEDRWARAAVLSGVGTRLAAFFEALGRIRETNPKAFAVVMEDLGRVFGAGAPLDACRQFLAQMLAGQADLDWRMPSVLGLAEGLRGRPELKGKNTASPFAALLSSDGASAAGVPLDKFFHEATKIAADERAPTRQRVTAVALLGYTDFKQSGPVLGALLDARHAPGLQLQAVRALERFDDPRGAEMLIQPANWTRYTPQIREAVIATLVAKPQMIGVLFSAIRAGAIKAPEISSPRRTQLLKHADAKIRQEAEGIFHELESGDRMQVYRAYRSILDKPGDARHGGEVFVRSCSACHTYNGAGGKVGPDLTVVRSQPSEALLLHILVPNFEVAPGYKAMTATTQDGRTLSGWLASETEGSFTLRTAFGTDETVLRGNIASLTASGLSLMPDGLEQSMNKDELNDLISYLKSTGANSP